jgi:hypothetical protein
MRPSCAEAIRRWIAGAVEIVNSVSGFRVWCAAVLAGSQKAVRDERILRAAVRPGQYAGARAAQRKPQQIKIGAAESAGSVRPATGEDLHWSCSEGNPTALRLCMERLFPARRDASVRVRLPRIKTFRDLDKAADRAMQDVEHGKLTPTDGERMVNMLEGRSRILDSVDNASRIDQLERDWAAAQKRRPAA